VCESVFDECVEIVLADLVLGPGDYCEFHAESTANKFTLIFDMNNIDELEGCEPGLYHFPCNCIMGEGLELHGEMLEAYVQCFGIDNVTVLLTCIGESCAVLIVRFECL